MPKIRREPANELEMLHSYVPINTIKENTKDDENYGIPITKHL